MLKQLILLTLVISFPVTLPAASAIHVDNTIYASLLKKYVSDGRVDYDGFKTEENRLDQYLDILSRTDTESLPADERFAFYINAYNAFTIKLILTRYPEIDSIKDIGGLFSSPWSIRFIELDGQKISLDTIEHDILRPRFRDARIHFAVNCASKGCPPLRNEPYEGNRIDRQLDDQTRRFLNAPGNVVFENGTLYLSKLFKWFEEDFTPSPVAFVKSYAAGELEKKLDARSESARISYLNYDWSLNRSPRQ